MIGRKALLICGLGAPALLAATDVACLQSEGVTISQEYPGFSMMLRSHCDRDVTAYRLDATVYCTNGQIIVLKGMKHDFMPSLMFPNLAVGQGPIKPGEVRSSPLWGIPHEKESPPQISEARPRITAVVFRDRTAIGEEVGIQELFESRRLQLQELRFWQQSFKAAKGSGRSPADLLRFESQIDVPARKDFAKGLQEKVEIEAIGGGLKRMLVSAAKQTEEGKATAQDAVARFERYLDDRTAATEQHSLRAK